MAHYRFIVFHEPDSCREEISIDQNSTLQVDGFIIDDLEFSRDTLRWVMPEANDEEIHNLFQSFLRLAANQAAAKKYAAYFEDKHL